MNFNWQKVFIDFDGKIDSNGAAIGVMVQFAKFLFANLFEKKKLEMVVFGAATTIIRF